VFREIGIKDAIIDRYFKFRDKNDPAHLAEQLEKEQIRFMLHADEDYPPLLRQISDPPYALFVRGNADLRVTNGCAIVGTRRNTPYGRTVAETLGKEFARNSIPVISGLAGGIDSIAHEAALKENGTCIAVLGTGVDADSVYPKCNIKLSEQILEKGGALISEFPPRTESLPFHFPLRNRIISGMSKATIVVEAADKSGSLITAFQALEQNRDVFAVPGPITHAQSYGTNRLLAMGAIPLVTTDDVVRILSDGKQQHFAFQATITADQHQLLQSLNGPCHTDDLARSLKQPIAAINALLARLEMNGLVIAQGAQTYIRAPCAEPLLD
jgi:DNA processing protein